MIPLLIIFCCLVMMPMPVESSWWRTAVLLVISGLALAVLLL
jgi:hypothetical protein